MKTKDRKKLQSSYAFDNILFYFDLLDKRFNPEFDKQYVREIKRLSQGFNLRLEREDKLKFCNKCNVYWDSNTRVIRLNSKTCSIEYICRDCNYIRRFRYK